MKHLASLAALLCLTACGQPANQMGGFGGGGLSNPYGYPLTILGYRTLAVWNADSIQTNSGSNVSLWPDSYLNAWHMTQTNPFAPVFYTNGPNGHAFVSFPGNQTSATSSMSNFQYTSPQPEEVVMVVRPQFQPGPWTGVYFDGNGGSLGLVQGPTRDLMLQDTSGYIESYWAAPTNNTWFIWDLIWGGAGISYIYTNNSVLVSNSPTLGAHSTWVLGDDYPRNGRACIPMDIAWVQAFGGGGPIPGTNSVARTALYTWLKQRFGL